MIDLIAVCNGNLIVEMLHSIYSTVKNTHKQVSMYIKKLIYILLLIQYHISDLNFLEVFAAGIVYGYVLRTVDPDVRVLLGNT